MPALSHRGSEGSLSLSRVLHNNMKEGESIKNDTTVEPQLFVFQHLQIFLYNINLDLSQRVCIFTDTFVDFIYNIQKKIKLRLLKYFNTMLLDMLLAGIYKSANQGAPFILIGMGVSLWAEMRTVDSSTSAKTFFSLRMNTY